VIKWWLESKNWYCCGTINRINHKTEVTSMEFVKKTVLTLSMAFFVTTPLSAYIFKVEQWVHEEIGKTVHLFHDVHPKNYEAIVKQFSPQHSNNPAVRNIITKADVDTHNQLNDIINEAKQHNVQIIIEGPYINELKKLPPAMQQRFNDLLIRKLYKQTRTDNISINAEVRSCISLPFNAVTEKFFGHLDLATKQAYWQGKLPIMPHLSEELNRALEKTIENYAAAHKNHREKLDNFEDGPIAQQYYNETMIRIENNSYHKLMINFSPQKKQTLNNKNQTYKNEIDLLQKKAILSTQLTNIQLHDKLVQDLLLLTGSLLLLDTNIIHNIINSEKDVMFVVAGAAHCQNLADPLTRLGYKKVKTTERVFANNPLHRPVPGVDSQCIPVHISEHFGAEKKYLENIGTFTYILKLLRTWMGLK